MDNFKTNPKIIRLTYFWIGIIATVAYRIIVVLNNYTPLGVKIAWYIGTIGFVFYFAHRFRISAKRERMIKKYGLVEKINALPNLSAEEKSATDYVVRSLSSSLERWNYIFIFIASGMALTWGILDDFIF